MEKVPIIQYFPGEVIIQEGDSTNNIFLIISGKVRVIKNTKTVAITLAEQGKDTIFGEMTLIDGKKRSASVIALEETHCYQCDGSALLKEIEKLPGDLRAALQSMAAIIRAHNKMAGLPKEIKDNMIKSADDINIMSEAEIKSDLVQDAVHKIANPFVRSLFRVMMATAFKK
jgi:CRP-like cAMP-binding protein